MLMQCNNEKTKHILIQALLTLPHFTNAQLVIGFYHPVNRIGLNVQTLLRLTMIRSPLPADPWSFETAKQNKN